MSMEAGCGALGGARGAGSFHGACFRAPRFFFGGGDASADASSSSSSSSS